MELVVGIQVDADARIFYVHMDDLKHCAPPYPEPSWPDVTRGTSIVVSTRPTSTLAPTEVLHSHTTPDSAHQSGSVSTMGNDVRASTISDQSEDVHTDTDTPTASVWELQDAKCILSKNSVSVALTLRGFASSQWKGCSTHYNSLLWVIRNILDSLLNTHEWTMSKDA